MDKVSVKEIIDNFNGDENELYKSTVYIDMPSNGFDFAEYYDLIFKSMYLYHKLYGIDEISTKFKLPFPIDRKISFQEFIQQIEKYKQFPIEINLLPNVKNHYDNIVRLAAYKLLDTGDFAWTRVYSSRITGKKINQLGKMYISVDNKDLHKFANLLFDKCIETGMTDYEFKINNDQHKTRRDNVVIFFTSENYSQYISFIDEIIAQNKDIKINPPHLFGYAVNDYVRIGKDFFENTVSFTNQICNIISVLKEENKSTNEIINIINEFLSEALEEIIILNDEKQKSNS